jgi:ketosteroid isomerase-like protein
MTTSKNIETVQQIYAAVGRGDLKFILDQLDDEVTWGIESVAAGEVPAHGVLRGKQNVPKFFAAWADTGTFATFDADDFVAAGDHVFNHLHYDFTVKATGKSVKNRFCMQHWTFRNGKIVRWRGYEDTAATRDAYRK